MLSEVLGALYRAGARPAKPGEFTRRAFLNGKMDLTQAEAVIDLIDAETVQAARNAAAQLEGAMGSRICGVKDRLVDIASEFYAYVDYPDDEIEESALADTLQILEQASHALAALADSYDQGRILRDGVACAIIGRPNAGKSSILNALAGYERSIVTDIAGTTRDTVEEVVVLGGVRLRLIDTAGLRDTSDTVERMGVARAEQAASRAELLLVVFDGARTLGPEDLRAMQQAEGRPAIAVINKDDLPGAVDRERIGRAFGERVCAVSATEQRGLENLEKMIARLFSLESISCDGGTVTNPRHAAALRSAAESAARAHTALAAGLTPDVAVSDVEAAIDALGELTGASASEQVLQRIFERFCVGK